jgi:carbonic anhydrase
MKAMTGLEAKPENGFAGLRHWRHDLLAGFIVALISTPFSIGIAVASGAPPITGLTSAIIAGFILPFIGGSYVTISGPAAGLAPVLYTSMLALGAGSLSAGYPLLLPVIFLAGIFQIILYRFRIARFCNMFPSPVVEGMLAAIGLMIIVKQFPTLLGHSFQAHEFWAMLKETPQELPQANFQVMGLGLLTLCTIILLNWLGKGKAWIKVLPPHILAVGIGTALSLLFFHLHSAYLIQIPDNPLSHGITLPDFQGVFQNPSIWGNALLIAIMLTLIDGIESLATIHAVDKIDPFHRKSNPDKTLLAMGVSNLCSSLVGGLTIIPGGVKSTANVMAGARTQWANFYNACFLLIFMLCFHQQINQLPLVVLSVVLGYTGYKLCRPAVWQAIAKTGTDQLMIFAITVLLTLSTDLMWGILGGMAFAFFLNLLLIMKKSQSISLMDAIRSQFESPVARQVCDGEMMHLSLKGPLVSFNASKLLEALDQIPDSIQRVQIHFTEEVTHLDHTTMDHLFFWMMQQQALQKFEVELVGLDRLRQLPLLDEMSSTGEGQLLNKKILTVAG